MFWFNRQKEQQKIIPLTSNHIEHLSGRRHLKDVPYLLPKDISDQNRLDLQHFLFRQSMHGNYLAPIENPQRILDVACGTGRWGAEMAQEFPSTTVIGFDLEPPLPSSNSIRMGNESMPGNYSFVKGDMTAGLPFPDNSFEFVHMRLVILALPQKAWLSVVQELYRVTAPGGWIELVEGITEVNAKTRAWGNFNKWLRLISEKRQLDLEAGFHIGDYLRNTSARQVQHLQMKIPLGSWGGNSGKLLAADFESAAKGLKGPFVQAGLVKAEAYDITLEEMARDLERTHSYQPIFIAFGQK